jgi:hypothetical protein
MCRKQALAEVQALAAVGEINDSPNMFSMSAISIWNWVIGIIRKIPQRGQNLE